jgi:cytochrome c6
MRDFVHPLQASRVAPGIFIFSVFVFVSLLLAPGGTATDLTSGQKLFSLNCASCHDGGQNLVNPDKPIIGSTKLISLDSFKKYLCHPSGSMPPFERLTKNEADLARLYQYVLTLK